MTQEKRKRGRPKKIASFQELKDIVDEGVRETSPEAASRSQLSLKTLLNSEKLIPPAGLSKVATLQWLTANKK